MRSSWGSSAWAWHGAMPRYLFPVPRLAGEIIIGFGAGFYLAVLSIYFLKVAKHRDPCVDRRQRSQCVQLSGCDHHRIDAGRRRIDAIPRRPWRNRFWMTGVAGARSCHQGMGRRSPLAGRRLQSGCDFSSLVHSRRRQRRRAVDRLGRSGTPTLNWMIFGCALFFWIAVFCA